MLSTPDTHTHTHTAYTLASHQASTLHTIYIRRRITKIKTSVQQNTIPHRETDSSGTGNG